MARRKKHNPERRSWRGRSHKQGGEPVKVIREKRACVACGRPMAVRPDGCPWHAKCGREGGME